MNTNQIAVVASGVINLLQTGQIIYQITANAMDAIEQNSNLAGADKKSWVMAYVKSVVIALGENWEDYVLAIANFIDQIKTAYNAVKSLFN